MTNSQPPHPPSRILTQPPRRGVGRNTPQSTSRGEETTGRGDLPGGARAAEPTVPMGWLWALCLAAALGGTGWVTYRAIEAETRSTPTHGKAGLAAERGERDMAGEALRALAETTQAVSEGERLFATHCAACHGARGQGRIGPNLTDGHWLHGGSAESIHESIGKGIPDKGMPAWNPTLGAVEVRQVSAYVLTLRGRHVPGKPPQGRRWTAAASAPEDASR